MALYESMCPVMSNENESSCVTPALLVNQPCLVVLTRTGCVQLVDRSCSTCYTCVYFLSVFLGNRTAWMLGRTPP